MADATASTFLAVLESCTTFCPERGSGAAWLFTIARNQARRQYRGLARDGRLVARLRGRDSLSPTTW